MTERPMAPYFREQLDLAPMKTYYLIVEAPSVEAFTRCASRVLAIPGVSVRIPPECFTPDHETIEITPPKSREDETQETAIIYGHTNYGGC